MQIINTLVLIAATFITIEAKNCGCKSSKMTVGTRSAPVASISTTMIQASPTPIIPAVSNIAYGVQISSCTKPNTVALTFDDGPADITAGLLDILATENVKATFFVVGENILRYSAIVKRAFDSGHQIASHSNTHANFTAL
eukprot:Partr_v1_DN25951_c0_g2_i3_m68818 putative chitin deacetylase